MSLEHDIEGKLKEIFKDSILETTIPREHRLWVKVPVSKFRDIIRYLKDNFGFTHITTITAIDAGEEIEIIYHLFSQGVTLNLKTAIPMATAEIETITDILPGATLYEREAQDLMGVKFKNHPDPRRLVLPDDWPEGVYPLRKSYSTKEG